MEPRSQQDEFENW